MWGNRKLLLNNMIFNLYKGDGCSISIIIIHVIIFLVFLIYWDKHYRRKKRSIDYREELFNSLCSNIDDAFVIYHLKKKEFEYISPNIERIFGISVKALKEEPENFLKFTDIKRKDEIRSFFTTNILSNNYETECEYCHPVTNKVKWIEIRFYPVYNNFKVIRYICCVSDLTRIKKSQEMLTNAFLNSQKANEAKKEFLSHMSHELRTPINQIIGMSRIATDSILDKEKIANCMDKITTSSNDLLKIINNILDMVKIDSDKLRLSKEPFHLIEFLNSFLAISRTQTEMKQQEMDLVLADIKDNYIIGDSLRIGQILSNCVSNSTKFTQTGGKIKLEICEVERHNNKALFRFTITDNGKGMSEDFMDRLFIPFEQEDSSISMKYGGSGLGMTITKNLVMLMGGTIRASSKVGIGTSIIIDIIFQIPCSSADSASIHNNIVGYDFTGHRVLVVEDNDINLEITCELLKKVKVTIETATNGYEALELFKASAVGYYEVIIMDVQMPGLNGYETAKAIRSSLHQDANDILIIAMSADTSLEDTSFNLDCGINNHLSKPIDLDYLYSLLQRVFTKEDVLH